MNVVNIMPVDSKQLLTNHPHLECWDVVLEKRSLIVVKPSELVTAVEIMHVEILGTTTNSSTTSNN